MLQEEMVLLAAEFLWASRWNALERAEVIRFLQEQCALTEEQANQVIVSGLAHALLGVDPTNSTRRQVAPKPPQQR